MCKYEAYIDIMIIYRILNQKNNKSYVGKSIGTFKTRYSGGNWHKHSHSALLKSDVEKYGKENFEIQILEDNILSIEELNKLEVLNIKKYNCIFPNGYNFDSGGDEGKYYSEEALIIIRKKRDEKKEKRIYKLKNWNTGEIVEFNTFKGFGRKYNISDTAVASLIKGKTKLLYEWSLPDAILETHNFLSPEGNLITIPKGHLIKFCKDNNLNYYRMSRMLNYKGYTSPDLCGGYRKVGFVEKREVIFKLLNPKGEEFVILEKDLRFFCQTHNLNYRCIREVLNIKKHKTYKGWKNPNIKYHEAESYLFKRANGEEIILKRTEVKDFCIRMDYHYMSVRSQLSRVRRKITTPMPGYRDWKFFLVI